MMSDRFFSRHYRTIGLLALASSILLSGLGSARLWDRDEPRNARCAEEMLARGDWVVPTFNDQLRDHKPVLLYWLQMAGYQVLGSSEWTARLPSALLGIVTVFSIAFLASRLAGEKRWVSVSGFWSGATLVTCLLFVMAGRAATPDSCLIAFSTLGIAALVIGAVRIDSAFGSSYAKRNELTAKVCHKLIAVRWPLALLGYVSFGLAMLAKGPVGLILPMIVLHAWWVLNQPTGWRPKCEVHSREQLLVSAVCHWKTVTGAGILSSTARRLAKFAVWFAFCCWYAIIGLRTIPGCLLALVIAAPWYIEVGLATDGAFLRGFLLDHNLGRAVSSMEGHDGSIFYYPGAFLVGTFPWSLWLIPIALWAKENLRRLPLAISLGFVWILVYVGAFTLANTKLPSYITPCYPGAALLIGGYMRDFRLARLVPSILWRRTAGWLGVLVGIAISIALPIVAWHQQMPLVGFAGLGGVALAASSLFGLLQDRKRTTVTPVAWLAGAVAFQVSVFAVGAGLASRYRTDVDALIRVQTDHPSSQWICLGGMEPSWVYYLEHPITEMFWSADPVDHSRMLERLKRMLINQPNTNIILSAELAHLLTLDGGSQSRTNEKQHDFSFDFHEVARCNRFLRPGEIVIYKYRPTELAERRLPHPVATR